LERSGRLKTSVTVPGGPDNINSITKTEMIVGTRVPYAIVHHKGLFRLLTNKSGWTLPSAHVTPQRKIIELTSDQRKRWVHIMHNYLYGLYKEAAAATKEGVSWT
jgi:phage gpG-like protein